MSSPGSVKKPAWGAKAAPAPPVPQVPTAVQYRGEIEAAFRDGLAPEELTLRLTYRAADSLRRDRSVPDDDISYANGQMRFLGVAVVAGVEASALEKPAAQAGIA